MALSYESSGVRYDQLDAFKRACQRAARTTAELLTDHGYAEPATTRRSIHRVSRPDHEHRRCPRTIERTPDHV